MYQVVGLNDCFFGVGSKVVGGVVVFWIGMLYIYCGVKLGGQFQFLDVFLVELYYVISGGYVGLYYLIGKFFCNNGMGNMVDLLIDCYFF